MTSTVRNRRLHACQRFPQFLLPALLLCLVTLAGCSVLKPIRLLNTLVPAAGYTLQSDLAYGADQRQTLDIYSPTEPASDSRIIVFVYGGAWREGNRSEYEFVGQALAEAGHTVVIPDYRLYPVVAFPEIIGDVANAVAALNEQAIEWLGYPVDQVVLMGHSSGAHAAALLASDPGWLANSDITASALVAISGPYDLPLDNPEVEPVFRNLSGPDEARPVALVTPAHPPTLLIHGEDDDRVLPFHTRNYSAALTAAGVPVEVHWMKDTGHARAIASIAAPLDTGNRNRRVITTFLDGLAAVCQPVDCRPVSPNP